MEGGNDQPQNPLEDETTDIDDAKQVEIMITQVEDEINEIGRAGIDVKEPSVILTQAKSAHASQDLQTVFHYLEQCKMSIIETRTRHNNAVDKLESVRELITESENVGVDVEKSPAVQMLQVAEKALASHDYTMVGKLSESIHQELELAREQILMSKDIKNRTEYIIKTAQSHIDKTKEMGLKIVDAEKLMTSSLDALNTSKFEAAQQYAKDAIKICRNAKMRYNDLQEKISTAQTLIVNNKLFIDTTNAQKFLDQSSTEMSKGDYSAALISVNKVFKNITHIKTNKSPEVSLKNPDHLTFTRDTWEKCELEITNNGKVHAKEVMIKFPDEIETRGQLSFDRLNAGETRSFEIGIRSKKIGEIPLDIDVFYSNPLTMEKLESLGLLWINIEPAAGESKDTIQFDRFAERATLSLSKRGNEYDVGFKTSKGAGAACEISEFIKISPETRTDIISKINQLVTMLNIFCRADEIETKKDNGKKDEKKADISEMLGLQEKVQELAKLGELIYGMFLPVSVQANLKTMNEPLSIITNDNEIPWEFLHDKSDFLCLKVPIGRRIRTREVARVNEKKSDDNIRILFIANASGDLDSAETEIEYIIDRLGPEVEVEILKGQAGTNAAILSAFRSGAYDIIHYAGHAEFNPASPDESALCVANEGKIFAQEIKRTLGGNPLVFLNACSSGVEKMCEDGSGYSGSDTEGLASSFLLGGALALIGSSWPMPDVSAGYLASKFYENFLQGDPVGEALRKARLAFIKNRAGDVNWMAFILFGDPNLRISGKIIDR